MPAANQTLKEAFGNIFGGIKPKLTKINEIFLDSDNVMLNWWTYVEENHLNRWTQAKLNSLSAQDRDRVLDKIYEEDPDLFAKLKPYTNAVPFILHLRELGVPVFFLTAAGSNHPDQDKVASDKAECIYQHFNFTSDKVIVVDESSTKQRFSKPGSLLVDDFERNIREWRLQGGTAIHFDSEKGDSFEELFNSIKALMGIAPDKGPVWGSVCKVEKEEKGNDEEE